MSVPALIDAGAEIVRRSLTLASGGNLSARIPGTDRFVVTGTGTWLDRLTPDQFTEMTLDGEVVSGPKPSVEWKLHCETYRKRPDVNSVIHVHPQTAVLLDALGYPVRLITLDHVYYLREVKAVPFFPAGSHEIADSAADAAATGCNCIILSNHGSSTLGPNVEMALRRALLLEEAATATFRALQLGDKTTTFPAEWINKIDTI